MNAELAARRRADRLGIDPPIHVRLSRLADWLVSTTRVTQLERDRLVTALREGEKRILELESELRLR